MLGSHALFIQGITVLAVGFILQVGATGAVKAVKMSAHLVAARATASGMGGAGLKSGPSR
jgi:hypothetical protein